MGELSQTTTTGEETEVPNTEEPLSWRVVLSGIAGGVAGLIAMAPIVGGVPYLLGIFEVEALASFSEFIIGQPSALLGLLFFIGGGAVVLPLFFVATATFLPPQEPVYLRGVTISSIFWVTFIFIFWPGNTLLVNAAFLVVTLVAHWVYGAVLGLTMQKISGIPEHAV